MFNFAVVLGCITVPLVVGYLAQGYGFAPALVYISAVALIGALSYILLVGDVKRVGYSFNCGICAIPLRIIHFLKAGAVRHRLFTILPKSFKRSLRVARQ